MNLMPLRAAGKWRNRPVIVVGRTIEEQPRYDLLLVSSNKIVNNIPATEVHAA